MPTFYVLSGPDLGKTFEVGVGAVIGRVPECDVVVRGGAVSRKHARLDQVDGIWTLVDLDSRNGIHCEGVRRKRIDLQDGQLFEIGKLELRFRADVGVAPPARVTPKVEPTPPASREPAPSDESDLSAPSEGVADPNLETGIDEADDPEIRFDSDEDEDEVDFGGEIEFEDEDLFDAPAPAPKAPPSPPPSAPASRPAAAAPAAAPRPASAPSAAPPASRPAANAPRRSMGGGGGVAEVRDAGRPALQFSKQAHTDSFFSSDLSQYPLWVKWLAGLLALALFVGLFYVAFRSSASLKERAVGGGDVEVIDDEGY